MNNNVEIMSILHYKHNLEEQLNNMICGSVEVREKDEKRYIYVHYRELGRNVSKYVGEYSDDLYNLVLNNNLKFKVLKKEIKALEKKLKELNYQESELSEEVKLNIDFATLLEICIEKKLIDINRASVDILNDLRNHTMHHSMLLFGQAHDLKEAKANFKALERQLNTLLLLLPEDYRAGFNKSIDSLNGRQGKRYLTKFYLGTEDGIHIKEDN